MITTPMSVSASKKVIYLVAQNIRSLFNVGGLFRCADVFGVKKVFLTGYTGFPPRSEISKTALGAERWVAWEHQTQTVRALKQLKKQGAYVIVLETGKKTVPLPRFKPRFPLALVVGNEVTGVTAAVKRLADAVVSIPMHGRKESLNVMVAAGIALDRLRNSPKNKKSAQ